MSSRPSRSMRSFAMSLIENQPPRSQFARRAAGSPVHETTRMTVSGPRSWRNGEGSQSSRTGRTRSATMPRASRQTRAAPDFAVSSRCSGFPGSVHACGNSPLVPSRRTSNTRCPSQMRSETLAAGRFCRTVMSIYPAPTALISADAISAWSMARISAFILLTVSSYSVAGTES